MRDKIIDATVEEFKQNGLKFTMNDLAKRLGISKKTIYTVFESKQAVLVAVVRSLCGRFKQYAGRTGGERKSECSAETGEAFVCTARKVLQHWTESDLRTCGKVSKAIPTSDEVSKQWMGTGRKVS